MSKLKQKKYIASILIMVIVLGIIGLFLYGKVDKYKGQIKVGKAKLLGSVVDTGLVTSKGTEEVKYNLTYTLDPVEGLERRDVVIKGKLNSPYARFKEINKNNITSTLINDGQEIEINIEDVRLGEQKELELIIKVLNAPNKENIIPEISIKEKTGEYTNVTGNPIKVETNSIQGTVLDENNLPVSNIELSINKNGREIKRTYTSVEGNYVFSDLEEGEYIIKVEEDIYEIESGEKVTPGEENNKIKVKQVDKYNVETKKYIERLDLVVNGKENHYTYKDAEKVIENVKNAKRISGKIEYKIVVRNKSDKQVEIDEIEDKPGEGLEFKESENTGWKNKNGKIVYELMEGVSLRGKEKREIKLVLSINDTNEIKTYINKMTSRGEIKEKVVFVIDNKVKREIEVTEGTVIERSDFHIDDLDGWYTDSNYTNKYKFSNRVNKDLILYAKTHEVKPTYRVRYIDKNEVIKEEEVEEGNKTSAPSDPSKRGYTFNCWKKGNSCFDFDTPIEEDIDLTSDYNIITYQIEYNLQGGTVTGNPGSYTVETNPFTLVNPTKEGYTFVGWTGSNGDVPSLTVTLPEEELGDKNYTANYSINRYELEIDPKGGSYPGELLIEGDYGEIITISEPTKEGYNFTGWTLSGKGTYNNGIYTFGEGNGKLEANYSPIEYTITYKEITDAERELLSNPTSYTIGTNEFTLNNPADRLDGDGKGEVFVGWKEKNTETPSMVITLPDRNNLGNKEYTAVWQEKEADRWNITYDFDGATTIPTNPSSYVRSDLPITLNNPTKTGYDFIGWTGSNGETPSAHVVIPTGTEEDLSYKANFTLNDYTITYDYTSCNLTPIEITTLNNRGSYTVLDDNFSLNNPNKYGYKFTGWTGTDLEEKALNVLVDTNKAKNLSYKANCELEKYDVEFYNYVPNSEYSLVKTVEDIEYNTLIPTSEIPSVSLRGYTFKYWSLDKTNEYDFNTPITENTKLYAVYQKDTYNITYELDGGTVTGNPDSYQVDTESFTLNNPSKTGYEFIGWTGSCGDNPLKTVTLPEEELGDKNYIANYEKEKYIVTYMNGETKHDEEEVEYNEKATGNVETPTKAHNIFTGWTLNGNPYDFNTPVTSNITLYASFEEVEAPTITHTPTTWVKDKVLVTVTSDHTDYTYMYKIGNGTYQSYSEPFEVDENTTVYAYSVKSDISSVETSHEINNIDKINPSINSLEEIGKTPTSVTIKTKFRDLESGSNILKIYVDNELVFESPAYTEEVTEEKEIEYTVGNLEQLTTYTIKAEILDKVGNVSTEEIEVTTPEKHYVARTLDEDGVEIRKYETLKEAIESSECVSICRIEMLDNVEETNSVLDGQDIKLDLNGFTITGLQDKAFENNGILQIVDYNEDEVGKVYSSGTAIINTGKLIIGENEEPLEVSKTEPIIEGLVTGINSPGELHFYDGKIIGGSTTGALKGSAPITPYSYNASVETSGDKEIVTLEIIAEAEARINSVYYTKVQEAVDASKNGSYVTPEGIANIMSQAKTNSDYDFTYDEVTNTLTSNNNGISNSVADSYIYIDTRNEANDKVISVKATVSSDGADYGYVHVTESKNSPSYDDTNNRYIIINGEKSDNVNILIEKGKEYYLHFGYRKDGSGNYNSDNFVINDIKLSDYNVNQSSEMSDYIISNNEYHFSNNGVDGYTSNINGIDYGYAHSYLEIDMTNNSDEEYITIDATIGSEDGDDVAFIAITDSKDNPDYDASLSKTGYLSGNTHRDAYVLKLIPNQVNYVHFVYTKDRSSAYYADSFTIHSVKLSDQIFDEMLPEELTPAENYYMYSTDVMPGVWSDLSNNGNDGYEYNTTWDETNHGLVFNGSNSYVSLPEINPTELTVRAKFMIHQYQSQFVIGNYEGGGYAIYVNASKQLVGGVYVNGGYKEIKVADTQLDTLYDVTLTYDGEQVNLYVNGVRQTPIDSAGSIVPPSKNTHLMLGTNPVRNESNSQFLNGTIYDIKVYDKAQTEDEVNNESTDQMIIHLDGTNHEKHSGNYKMINNNQQIGNSQADSYMMFDMTNVSTPKKIYVNAEVSSEGNYDYGYVIVTDSPDIPNYSSSTGRYVYIAGEVAASDYEVSLQPGIVNYVHFGYRKDGGTDRGTDTFTINSIKYYEDSDRTIPVYIFSNTSGQMVPNPVPELNQDPDTVQILRNITMTKPLDIVETRNVVLDLNGYILTQSVDDYVIDNKGSLKIIDTDYDGQVERAIEKYEREQAEYDRQYEEEQARNQEKYEEDVQEYNNFINNYKEHFVKDFTYTGSYQEFTAPTTGTYKIEAWGAQGGTVGDYLAGKGAYTSGNISLTKGQKIYVYVGGQPTNDARQPGGYNGGGNVSPNDDGTGRSGGGSTDIRLVNGDWSDTESLASRIMVAAGGGGSACEGSSWCASGGSGGALVGLIPTNMGSSASSYYGTGGTQTAGGTSIDTSSYRPSGLSYVGTFGKGGDSASNDDCGAGGSGYYGGGGSNYASAGGGGSSYISGYKGSVAIKAADNISPKDGCLDGTDDVTCSYHYSGIKFDEATMIPGNEEMPSHSGTDSIEGNSGNGFARIKLIDGDASEISDEVIEDLLSEYSYNYDYTGSYQEFIAPMKAKYKIEAWGGSGSVNAYGGYTSGEIELEEGEKLYIYVGNKWTSGNNKTTFNGGTGNQGGYNGGSSTDIRLVGGSWNDQTSLASRIMVAGAGGSGDGSSKKPGAGGGLIGYTGGGTSGGTQTEVGSVESSSYTSSSFGIANGGCTGGNGYYPGSGASCVLGAGGGSSFISGHKGSVAVTAEDDITPKTDCETGTDDIECSYHYSGKIFTNTKMVDGEGYIWSNFKTTSKSGMPTKDGTNTMIGNAEAGAVKITIASPELQQATRQIAELDTNQTINGKVLSTTTSTILNDIGGYLDFEQGNITIDKDGAYNGITNKGTLTMGDNAWIYGKKSSNRGIYNDIKGDIIDGTGNIVMEGSSNTGILNGSKVDDEIKGYNITVSNSNSTSFVNRALTETTIKGITTSGSGVDISQECNYDLTIEDSTLGSTGNESYYSNETSVESTVTFNNCDIKNRIYNRNDSVRRVVINNSTLSGSRGNVYNYDGTMLINNSTLVNSSWNIYNNKTMEIRDSDARTENSTSWVHNIVNSFDLENTATLTVYNSTFTTNTNDDSRNIFNYSGTAMFDGCTLNTNAQSVYNGTYSYYPRFASLRLKDTGINKTGSKNENVIYNYYGDVVIDGGSITTASDNSVAVYNESREGNVLTIKGDFSNSENFTRGVQNYTVFTLGDNDDTVSKTSPLIRGTTNAIYNGDNTTFNYYDGKLIGPNDDALSGAITDIAPLHDIYVTKGDTKETIILMTKEELEQDEEYVARIGNTRYATVQAAFDAVPDNNAETEVVILKDFETDAQVTLDENKNVKLNYDGHLIKTYNKAGYITNNGTLTLIDESNAINNKSFSSSVFSNNGTINYNSIKSMPIRTQNIVNNNENGTFNMIGGEIYSYQSSLVYNNGLFTMTSGKIYVTRTDQYGSSGYNLIVNDTSGEMNISGGEIKHIGSGSAIVNRNILNITDLTLNLLGCTGYRVRYTTYFINASEGSQTTVTGGSFGQTNPDGIFINNAGTAHIENVTSNLYGSVINSGNITLTNVEMKNLQAYNGSDHSPAFYTYNSGTMLIQGGSYKGSTNNAGFICEGTNSLTIDGAEISIYPWKNSLMKFSNNTTAIINNSSVRNNSNNSYNWGPVVELNNNSSLSSTNSQFYGSVKYPLYGNADGIYHNSTNEVTLTNVDVTSNKQAITRVNTGNLNIISGNYQSTSNEALYNSATGTITIGEKGGVPSKTSPSFTGNNYGLNNTNQEAIINFYDGIFSGTTAIQGKINEIEPGYEIILETDDKEHKFLDKLPIVKNTRTNGEFYTIQEALDDENFQNNDTLEVLREATIMPDALTINVSAGKIATIDLKGYKITQNNEKFIENNGTLSIKSSEDGGMIETNSSNIFENNGRLNIISGLYTTKTTDYVLVNNENAVTNITDGEINSYQTHVIYNDGEMNMTGGLVRATRTSNDKAGNYNLIENEEHGEITITGGEITFVGSGNTINNKNAVSVSGVKVELYGYYAYNDNHSFTRFVNNVTETSTALINGGSYGVEQNKGILIVNNGTAIVINTTTHFGGSIINYGTLDCINSNINMTYYAGGYNGAKNQPYTYNTGNMRVIGTKIIGKSNNTFVINEGSGRLDFIKSYIELYDAYWYNNEAKTIRSSGNSTINLEYTDVKTTATYASAGLYLNGNSSATLTGGVTDGDISSYLTPEELALLDSTNISLDTEFKGSITMSPTNERSDTYGIHSENSGNVSIDNFKVNTYRNAIHKTGSAQMDIISGEFISSDNNGIYNTGSGNISIGELGGTVSKTNPKITGKSYGLYNSSTTSEVNFYDGIITGNTAIYGKITDVEPTYEIIQTHNEDDTYSKYLDQIPLVKNTRTDEEFNTIQDAINDPGFTNGDTLEVLRELTTLPSYTTITIPSGTDVIIDMKGYKFNQNNEKLFVNNGTLKITDSESIPGNIQTFSGTIIENNGTMIVEKVKLYTETSISKLIINNENANFTFNNVNLTSPNYQLIQNDGTMNINGGNYKQTTAGNAGYDSECIINNTATGTLNISAGNFENRGNGTVGIYNYNILNITGGTFTEKGGGSSEYRYVSNCIYNASTGTLTIDGATFNNTHNYGRFLINYGTSTISNSTITMKYIMNNNSGTVSFTDNTITLPISGGGRENIYTVNSAITNITGGTITSTAGIHFLTAKNNAEINLTNTTIDANGEGLGYFYDNSHINVFGGTYRSTNSYSLERALFEFYHTSSGTFTNANIDGLNEYAISTNNNNTIDITNCNISSNITTLVITSNGVANINSGNITSTGANAVYVAGTSKVTVGEKGGVPSITSPMLYGKTYGVNHTNNTSQFNFYDGIIKGETGSISGIINNVEDGYKEKRDNVTDPDTGVTTVDSTLTVVGDTERVAMVGTVNFLSLQSAVNYASNNNIPDIYMFKNVTLEADLVKPAGGVNVIIHLNGTTITQGSYTIDPGITLDSGTAPGASVARFLANIAGEEINPRNIVIYELEDGSKLEANNTYKLYKEIGGELKIVKVKENEIGDYDLGYDKEILRTTRSRIYINGIGEGTYKLVGSDSKEITFTIYHDGVSSNIRENNNINGSRVSTAVATLILSLQTGMVRNPYILIIMILIVGILGFIALKKNQEYKVLEEDYEK